MMIFGVLSDFWSSDFLILMTLLKVDRSKVFESKNGYFQNIMINFSRSRHFLLFCRDFFMIAVGIFDDHGRLFLNHTKLFHRL